MGKILKWEQERRETMYNEIVRLKLVEERNRAGYTQRQLSELSGVHKSIIAKIEAGQRNPDPETIGALAEFYGVSIDYLFGLGRTPRMNP